MLPKLVKALSTLCLDFKALKNDFLEFKSKAPTVINGKDGVSPDSNEIVRKVLKKMPVLKDGRDGESPAIRDVADVVLADIDARKDEGFDINVIAAEAARLIPKSKDGVSPDIDEVAAKAAKLVPKSNYDARQIVKSVLDEVPTPKIGLAGPRGLKGERGVSVTDVQLNSNELFVFLDGRKKRVGKIKLPVLPFSPGGGSGATGPTGPDGPAGVSGRGSFSVTLSSSPVLVASVTTPILFDTIVTDRDSWFDVLTGRYTPQIAGDYFFTCMLRSSALPTGNHNWHVFFYINDIIGPTTFTRSGQSGDLNVMLSRPIFMDVDDFIDFRVQTTSGPGVTINTDPNTTMASGFLIHPT